MQNRDAEAQQEQPFNRQIYELAKAGDKPAILKLLTQCASLEELDSEWLITPGAKLAQEGDFAAANLLLELGANVDSIAEGAAMVNDKQHRDYAELLRKQQGACPGRIAQGAAFSGNLEYALWLHHQHGASLHNVFFGLGWGKHESLIERLLEETDTSTIINRAIAYCGLALAGSATVKAENEYYMLLENRHAMYAAAGGHEELTLYFWDRGHHNEVFSGIGRTNQLKLLQALRDRRQITDETESIQLGQIEGGHLREVDPERILEVGGGFNTLVRGGHSHFIDKTLRALKQTSGIASLLMNFVTISKGSEFGHLKFAVKLYKYWYFKNQIILPWIADSLLQESQDELIIHKLAFIKDHNFLNHLQAVYDEGFIVKAKSAAPRLRRIVTKAIKIQETMGKYDLDYDQAVAYLDYPSLRRWALLVSTRNIISDCPLPAEMIAEIVSKLSPLDAKTTRDLLDKVTLFKLKEFLAADLRAYYSYVGMFSKLSTSHNARAKSLEQAVVKSKDMGWVTMLVKGQYQLLHGLVKPVADPHKPAHEQPLKNANPKGGYGQLIDRHYKRLFT